MQYMYSMEQKLSFSTRPSIFSDKAKNLKKKKKIDGSWNPGTERSPQAGTFNPAIFLTIEKILISIGTHTHRNHRCQYLLISITDIRISRWTLWKVGEKMMKRKEIKQWKSHYNIYTRLIKEGKVLEFKTKHFKEVALVQTFFVFLVKWI